MSVLTKIFDFFRRESEAVRLSKKDTAEQPATLFEEAAKKADHSESRKTKELEAVDDYDEAQV